MTGLLKSYLGKGLAADIPDSVDVPPGFLAVWWSYDTGELWWWDLDAIPDPAWVLFEFSIAVEEAPSDGDEYVRKDGAWVINSGGAGVAFSGAKARRATADASRNYSGAGIAFTWDEETFDSGGWYDPAFPTYFTVPSGVAFVSMNAYWRQSSTGASGNIYGIVFVRDRSGVEAIIAESWQETTSLSARQVAGSGVFDVLPGDKLLVKGTSETDTSIIMDINSFMSVTALG